MNVTEIINKIKEVALSQKTVNSAFDGDVYDNWNSGEIKFASVNIGIQTVSNLNGLTTYDIVLYYGDRLLQDKSNVNDIWTDGCNTLQSILNIFNTFDMFNIQEDPITFTPFEQQFMDYLAGVYCEVNITTDSVLGACSMDDYTYDDTITINRNGEYYVALYEKAIVNVVPSGGTIEITENGTYDVTDYITAEVNLDIEDNGNYFYFQSRQDGSKVYMLTTTALTVELEYSFDKLHWTEWDFTDITLNSGDTVYFRGNNERFNDGSSSKGYAFRTRNARFDIGGDIRSLIDKTITITELQYEGTFGYLFQSCQIVNVNPKLLSGITKLKNRDFIALFFGCQYLLNAPELPWTELTKYCYYSMFEGCTSLTTAPELPATELKYVSYYHMFINCQSLKYIKCMATTNLQGSADNFTKDVPSGGTFIRDINADWSTVQNGIPSGWTVLVDNVPESALS